VRGDARDPARPGARAQRGRDHRAQLRARQRGRIHAAQRDAAGRPPN
jgi:hypothetical protein